MTLSLGTEQVWQALEKELFAVLSMVSAQGEARSAGIVYVTEERRLYVGTGKDAWKVRHVEANPHVSLTVPIAKRIPLMPWMKIPAATITFSGVARVLAPQQTPAGVLKRLFRGMAQEQERLAGMVIIEITPEKDFITYGVGVPLLSMRDPEQARGRAPVGRG
ncbi:MAG: pyridoxamine 5'-phosphate oxidase family protein [Caldilineales bacterium]